MTVPPEVLVVLFDRLTDIAQAVRGDHEDEVVRVHTILLSVTSTAAA